MFLEAQQNLCILILYPANLPDSLMSSIHFLMASLEFSMYSSMSSANCDSFTYSFPIWIPFFLFLVWFLWLGVPTLCWIQVERGDTFVLFLILEELSAFQPLNFMYLFGFGCSGSSVQYVGLSLWWFLSLQSSRGHRLQ